MAVIAVDRVHWDVACIAAPGFEIVATGAEVAAVGPFVGQGEVAGNGHQRAAVLVGPGQRDRPEERLRIGVAHLVEHVLDRPGFHGLARIHHAKPVAGFQNEAEVVRDEQHRGAVFLAQVLDQFHHGGLHRHVERGGGFIEDQKRRVRHQRHCDDDPLLLATRQLVREAVQHPLGVGQAHIGDHFERALVGLFGRHAFVDHRHFHQLLADLHRRIERGHRFLVDHGNFLAADLGQFLVAHLVEIAPLELDGAPDDAPVHAQVLHDPKRHGGFPATRFTHEAHGLARHHRAGEIHHRRDLAQAREEADGEVLDFQDRSVIGLCHGISPSGFLRAGRRPAG